MAVDKKDIPVTDRAVSMEKIIALCKNRGYIYPGSEIYGGLANTWDFGPLGVEFKNNIKDAWRSKFVRESKLNVGLDAAILMNPQTWVASGHVGGFSDPLIDCRSCKTRYRADQLIDILEEYGIKRCYYGHVHGHSIPFSFTGTYRNIAFRLVSADNLQFKPLYIE